MKMTTDTFAICYGCQRPLRPKDVWADTDVSANGHWFLDDAEIGPWVQGYFCRDCLDHPAAREDFASAERGVQYDLRKGDESRFWSAVLITAEINPDWTVARIAGHVGRSED